MVKLILANFTKALETHKDALGYNQFWRYKVGRVPKIVRWIAEYPDLAVALAEDAAALAAARAAQAGAARPTADCDEIARKGVAE